MQNFQWIKSKPTYKSISLLIMLQVFKDSISESIISLININVCDIGI